MMRRRRNQPNTRDRVAKASDHFIHLVAGELTALAGLCALRHFDLQFVGVYQIVCSDAETRRRNLLHGAAAQVAIRIALEPLFVFPALTGV